MVAVVPPILSDYPSEVPQRAGLGDRFHYFRGGSGRRYLFSTVPAETLADFRSAVVILAERTNGGRLIAHAITALDPCGRPSHGDRTWPPVVPPETVCLVHLLTSSEGDRQSLVADLTAVPMRLAA